MFQRKVNQDLVKRETVAKTIVSALLGLLFLVGPLRVGQIPLLASGACPGGGTDTLLVSGLGAITGGSALDRTSPANLVANGDFTIEPAGLASSGYPDRYYWGVGGLTVKNSVTATNQAIPSWTPAGGSAATYAFWTKSLTGNSNSLVSPPSAGESSGRVYFGNGVTASISSVPRFTTEGFSMASYTITPGGSYGSGSTPPSIDQDVSLVAGERYRMYFHQSTENILQYSGIAALDITGYQRIFFEVTTGNRGYMVEFTAVSSTTNIKFLSWGHLQNGGSSFLDVINRSATSSIVTLTTSSPHGRSAGNLLAVADVGARYDTTLVSVLDVPSSTTLRYVLSGTAETSTASTGYIFKPESGLSAELVLDDVIINACSASGVPSTTAPAVTATTTPGGSGSSPTTTAPGSSSATVKVSVGNSVWSDTDRDGVQDVGEPGIKGVVISVTKADGSAVTDVNGGSVNTTTTDANGKYLFENLPTGSYKVTVLAPPGYSPTKTGAGTAATDSSKGSAVSANLTENGSSDQTLDFGFVRDAVSVGNRVWKDVDRNGVQGAGEPGIANVVLSISQADGSGVKDVNGKPVKSTKTDANGVYLFGNLPPGSYKVTVVAPTGYSATKTGVGSTARDSSEGNATSGEIEKNGDSDQSLDFGFVAPLGGSAAVESAEIPVLSQTGYAPTWFLIVGLFLIAVGTASNRVARRRT